MGTTKSRRKFNLGDKVRVVKEEWTGIITEFISRSEESRRNLYEVHFGPNDYKLYYSYELEKVDPDPISTTGEKSLKITLKEAKEWYKKGGELRDLALRVYDKKDLEKVVYPRTWEEYYEQQAISGEKGYIIRDVDCSINEINWCGCSVATVNGWRNVLPSKELTESFLAYMQLISLRHDWIHKWSESIGLNSDWNNHLGFCICHDINRNLIVTESVADYPLRFPKQEMAFEFLRCFNELLKTAEGLF